MNPLRVANHNHLWEGDWALMPMVRDLASLRLVRGCVWRRCRLCRDLVALPHQVHECNACLNHARRGWGR